MSNKNYWYNQLSYYDYGLKYIAGQVRTLQQA